MATLSNKNIAQAIYLSLKDKSAHERALATTSIVKFLARRHLLSKSENILTELSKIENTEKGIIMTKVSSAKVLSEKTKRDLKEVLTKRYKGKSAVFSEKVDEKLLGGLRIEVDDEVIDFTLKNKIRKLQEHLIRSI